MSSEKFVEREINFTSLEKAENEDEFLVESVN